MQLTGLQNAEGEGCVFQGWEVLGQQKAVNSILYILSLRYREDKQISNGQLEIYVWRKGRKSGHEKEGSWEASSLNDKATEVDEIHPQGGSV